LKKKPKNAMEQLMLNECYTLVTKNSSAHPKSCSPLRPKTGPPLKTAPLERNRTDNPKSAFTTPNRVPQSYFSLETTLPQCHQN
jgi:hypothetical protein